MQIAGIFVRETCLVYMGLTTLADFFYFLHETLTLHFSMPSGCGYPFHFSGVSAFYVNTFLLVCFVIDFVQLSF